MNIIRSQYDEILETRDEVIIDEKISGQLKVDFK